MGRGTVLRHRRQVLDRLSWPMRPRLLFAPVRRHIYSWILTVVIECPFQIHDDETHQRASPWWSHRILRRPLWTLWCREEILQHQWHGHQHRVFRIDVSVGAHEWPVGNWQVQFWHSVESRKTGYGAVGWLSPILWSWLDDRELSGNVCAIANKKCTLFLSECSSGLLDSLLGMSKICAELFNGFLKIRWWAWTTRK